MNNIFFIQLVEVVSHSSALTNHLTQGKLHVHLKMEQDRFQTYFKLVSTGFKLVSKFIQYRITQLVAYWLGTREVPGSNPGKGKNF